MKICSRRREEADPGLRLSDYGAVTILGLISKIRAAQAAKRWGALVPLVPSTNIPATGVMTKRVAELGSQINI